MLSEISGSYFSMSGDNSNSGESINFIFPLPESFRRNDTASFAFTLDLSSVPSIVYLPTAPLKDCGASGGNSLTVIFTGSLFTANFTSLMPPKPEKGSLKNGSLKISNGLPDRLRFTWIRAMHSPSIGSSVKVPLCCGNNTTFLISPTRYEMPLITSVLSSDSCWGICISWLQKPLNDG